MNSKIIFKLRPSILNKWGWFTRGVSTQKKIIPSFIHTERFVLIDKYNRIRGRFYDGTNEGDVQQLIGDIKELKKETADAGMQTSN